MIQSGRIFVIIIDCNALAGYIFINMLAIASNSLISSLFTSEGGILGTSFTFHKNISVSQSVFTDLERSPSFSTRGTK